MSCSIITKHAIFGMQPTPYVSHVLPAGTHPGPYPIQHTKRRGASRVTQRSNFRRILYWSIDCVADKIRLESCSFQQRVVSFPLWDIRVHLELSTKQNRTLFVCFREASATLSRRALCTWDTRAKAIYATLGIDGRAFNQTLRRITILFLFSNTSYLNGS